MTKMLTASNINSAGAHWAAKEGTIITFGSRITDGIKPAIGRSVEVELDANSLAFLMSVLTNYKPQVITAAAKAQAECDAKYGPHRGGAGHYDPYYFERSNAVRDAVVDTLQGDS